MQIREGNRSTAILGVAFAVLFVGVMASTGDTPDETAPAAEVMAFYNDHASQFRMAAWVLVVAAVVLLFFGAGLREALRGDEATESDRLPSVAYAGAIVGAISMAIGAMSGSALVLAADSGNTDVVTTLNILDSRSFLLTLVGLSAIMLATGLRALRVPTVPRWLAWTSIVLGVLAPAGPGGFVAFFAFPFWVVAVGVALARRNGPPTRSDHVSVVATHRV
jgi:hypothetical protein